MPAGFLREGDAVTDTNEQEDKMAEPSEKYKDLDFLISRIGMPAVMCAALAYFMWAKFDRFEKQMAWDMQRSIRNERAIMQKLGIPVVLDGEQPAAGK